jgi:hypothetical protein
MRTGSRRESLKDAAKPRAATLALALTVTLSLRIGN